MMEKTALALFALALLMQPAFAVSIDTPALPDASSGSEYSATLTASGGSSPYTWSIISGKPDWLSIAPTGVLSGKPSAGDLGGQAYKTYDILVQVSDSAGNTKSAALAIKLSETSSNQLVPSASPLVCPANPIQSHMDVVLEPPQGLGSVAEVFVYETKENYVKSGMPNALIYMINQSDLANPQLCYQIADSEGEAQFIYDSNYDGCVDYWFIFCPQGALTDMSARELCLKSTGLSESLIMAPLSECNPGGPALTDMKSYPDHLLSHNELYVCNRKPKSYAALCWPLMLIFGLLVGASFLLGRNPFMAFDLSSPRMGRGKQYTMRVQQRSFDWTGAIMGAARGSETATGGKGLMSTMSTAGKKAGGEVAGAGADSGSTISKVKTLMGGWMTPGTKKTGADKPDENKKAGGVADAKKPSHGTLQKRAEATTRNPGASASGGGDVRRAVNLAMQGSRDSALLFSATDLKPGFDRVISGGGFGQAPGMVAAKNDDGSTKMVFSFNSLLKQLWEQLKKKYTMDFGTTKSVLSSIANIYEILSMMSRYTKSLQAAGIVGKGNVFGLVGGKFSIDSLESKNTVFKLGQPFTLGEVIQWYNNPDSIPIFGWLGGGELIKSGKGLFESLFTSRPTITLRDGTKVAFDSDGNYIDKSTGKLLEGKALEEAKNHMLTTSELKQFREYLESQLKLGGYVQEGLMSRWGIFQKNEDYEALLRMGSLSDKDLMGNISSLEGLADKKFEEMTDNEKNTAMVFLGISGDDASEQLEKAVKNGTLLKRTGDFLKFANGEVRNAVQSAEFLKMHNDGRLEYKNLTSGQRDDLKEITGTKTEKELMNLLKNNYAQVVEALENSVKWEGGLRDYTVARMQQGQLVSLDRQLTYLQVLIDENDSKTDESVQNRKDTQDLLRFEMESYTERAKNIDITLGSKDGSLEKIAKTSGLSGAKAEDFKEFSGNYTNYLLSRNQELEERSNVSFLGWLNGADQSALYGLAGAPPPMDLTEIGKGKKLADVNNAIKEKAEESGKAALLLEEIKGAYAADTQTLSQTMKEMGLDTGTLDAYRHNANIVLEHGSKVLSGEASEEEKKRFDIAVLSQEADNLLVTNLQRGTSESSKLALGFGRLGFQELKPETSYLSATERYADNLLKVAKSTDYTGAASEKEIESFRTELGRTTMKIGELKTADDDVRKQVAAVLERNTVTEANLWRSSDGYVKKAMEKANFMLGEQPYMRYPMGEKLAQIKGVSETPWNDLVSMFSFGSYGAKPHEEISVEELKKENAKTFK